MTDTTGQLDKTFNPAAIEARWYPHWESSGAFRPERPDAEPFTIVIPPPNVTGSLHIGHALDNTLQDILIRHARLKGKDALWVVGTDHAGIATQMVVERLLESQGQKRAEMGREAFLEHVWEWKAQSGGQITRQLRRLGASCDWANERFTMDEGFSAAVIKVFVELYNQGLLYRDKRLVNWDPKFRTAISDLEVETKEVQGHFWHVRYPLEEGSGHIVVATTRPETMLADMAVAVHPDDPRYKAWIGKNVKLPITGRLVPIVGDEHADPELGSGAVKITPGHDFNDFEVGKRAGFRPAEMLNMLDAEARVIQCGGIPDDLLGLDRFEARRLVVERLEALGLLEQVEDRVIQTPYGDRSGVVIEPWLTDQWYVDAATLAKPAIEAVRSGETRFVPETWAKTYFNWMENIQPWCVSRQLWWGHQIPAWYDGDGNVFVAENEEQARAQAGPDATLTRDTDVLDTWFSSALWPFGTLGWPDEAEKEPFVSSAVETRPSTSLGMNGSPLERYYPNSVLVTGFDIIFFWVARMMMQGIHFMGEAPFKTVYCHGLVRDAKGQKMSKSKGNTVDPLELIEKYGADAVRFTLAAMESQGRDIKLNEKRVEGYRNFATKLWNAARFCQSNGIGGSAHMEPPAATLPVNRWIIGETVKTVQALDLAMAEFRFDESANTIYHFVWATFCDWYLELIKGQIDEETRTVAGWVLDQILVMLHPFMPFITEELWHAMSPRANDLILAHWPMADARALDPEAGPEIDWLVRLVSEIRAARSELNVPPGARLALHVRDAGDVTAVRLSRHDAALKRLARIESVGHDAAPSGGAAQVIVDEATFVLPLEGVIDLAAEKARLQKAVATAEKERDSLAGRLSNPAFVEKAKPEAVAQAREDHAARSAEAERLRAALNRLG
ncbi:valine--tRNA ligase [Tardibacter chloracetimidivorans]|uniref:Valine--tRNA ligase n=1 Tax=Tardibacter chloracetimidivorans TaxID=1921510 RepID=A0A1L3ZU59_9SPHN|nr:valine--tRNA ligase [Tardibacter chloracetimidivorans]API59147.1 valine--tRNA ligase [Tardibacter chloracetimidivorans]